MVENTFFYAKKQSKNKTLIIVLLILSFAWADLYINVSSMVDSFEYGMGNLLRGEALTLTIFELIIDTLVAWAGFEILFWLYRYILSFKVYSFLVPMENLKNESRTFMIYKNLFYGLFLNICFVVPYLFSYALLVNLLATMIVLLIFCNHLSKTYSESIVRHFVFKNFCFPILIYEALSVIYQIWVVML